MKTNVLLLAALAWLASPTAHATDADVGMLPHKHLKFESAKKTFVLKEDDGGTVTVVFIALPKTQDQGPTQFDVTITRPEGAPRTYSLFTLGLQLVDHPVLLAPGTGADPSALPTFGRIDKNPENQALTADGLTLPPTGLIGGRTVDQGNIWLITLAGTTTKLRMQPDLGRAVQTQWTASSTQGFATGHGVEAP